VANDDRTGGRERTFSMKRARCHAISGSGSMPRAIVGNSPGTSCLSCCAGAFMARPPVCKHWLYMVKYSAFSAVQTNKPSMVA
jgi:hypothetical protein